MTGHVWSKFFWSDWESDEGLRQCSLAAQGLWMRMLCICAKGDPHGYLTIRGEALDAAGVAKAAGVSPDEAATLMAEMERWGVFSRDRKQRVYSRRLVRDAQKVALARKNGKDGGNPSLRKQRDISASDNPTVKGNDKPQKPEARSQKDKSSLRSDSSDFDAWWSEAPRKVGRGQALKAYSAARKRADAEALLAGIQRYAASCRAKGTEPQFIAHPATWLNGDRWLDEDAAPAPSQVISLANSTAAKFDAEAERKRRDDERMRECVAAIKAGRTPDPKWRWLGPIDGRKAVDAGLLTREQAGLPPPIMATPAQQAGAE